MKYRKNKLRLKDIKRSQRCRAFTFLLNLVWFLFLYWFTVKNPLMFFLRKNMFNSLLAFFFWKACTFSSFERFLCWKSRNYSQIYLSGTMNYWGSILTSYITWGAFSLVCVLSVFFFFLSSFFSFSIGIFLDSTNDS